MNQTLRTWQLGLVCLTVLLLASFKYGAQIACARIEAETEFTRLRVIMELKGGPKLREERL